MATKLVTAPLAPALDFAEVKDFLRIADTASDSMLAGLIVAARNAVEDFTRRRLVTQTWDMVLDDIDTSPQPSRMVSDLRRYNGTISSSTVLGFGNVQADPVYVPYGNLQSVSGVFVTDDTGVETTVSSSIYFVDNTGEPGRIILVSGNDWPAHRAFCGLRVRFVCGYGDDATFVPEAIKLAMKQMIARWYEYREETGQLVAADEALLFPYCMLRVSSTGIRR